MATSPSLSTQFLLALVIGMLNVSAAAEETPRDWNRLQFAGNETFTAKQLLDALIAEPDFLLATHPHGDKAGFREVTKNRLLAGYKHAGFASPEIKVQTLQDDAVSIQINEGRRFYCDKVLVNGAKQLDAQLLIDRLTQPYAKKDAFPTFVETPGKLITRWVDGDGKLVKQESPVWERGKPAQLNSESKLNLAAQAALSALGFSSSQILVSISTHPDTSRADLVVDILDEGKSNRVDFIEVTGSHVNSQDQVLEFLNLEPGFTFDFKQQQRLTKQLWESARFSKHQLDFKRDNDGTGRLCIELDDVPGVPPLTQPLNAEAYVFLRARQWLGTMDERDEDLVFSFEKNGVQVDVIQSKHGMLVQLVAPEHSRVNQPKSEGEINDSDFSLRKTAFVIDRTHVSISQSESRSSWKADVTEFRGSICLETTLSAAKSDEHFSNVTFNLNWHSKRDTDKPLLSHTLNLSPAGWCAFAYKKGLEIETVANKLIATRDTTRIEIDVETGEIIRWDLGTSTARVQVGIFEQMRNQIVSENARKENAYRETQPATSLIEFIASASCWNGLSNIRQIAVSGSKAFDSDLRTAVTKLASAGLFLPLDAFAIHTAQSSVAERFVIPDDKASPQDHKRWAIALVGKYTLKCLPGLFAEGTWPITVAREACLVAVGRGRHTNKVLKELQSDASTGPLCDASVACLLTLVRQPVASSFARRSLKNMDPVKFDRDLNVLLSGACGQWIAEITNAVGSMSDAEMNALGQLSKSERWGHALQMIKLLGTPAAENGSHWYQATQPRLELMLHEITRR